MIIFIIIIVIIIIINSTQLDPIARSRIYVFFFFMGKITIREFVPVT